MSVGRADGRSDGYDDLEVQVMDNDLVVQSDATSGRYAVPQYVSFEPLGGVQRGEVAELVAIHGQVAAHHQAIGGNTDPGSCEFSYELSTDPEIGGGHPTETRTDVDGFTGIDVNDAGRIDPDTLQKYVLRVGNIFDDTDTTNGTGVGGGGTTYASYDVHIDYRDFLGGGPTFDRHDNFYQHGVASLVGDVNSEYELGVRQMLYWDVKEEQ